jgi:hypothetical protein
VNASLAAPLGDLTDLLCAPHSICHDDYEDEGRVVHCHSILNDLALIHPRLRNYCLTNIEGEQTAANQANQH